MLNIKDKNQFNDNVHKLDDASARSLESKLCYLLVYGSNEISIDLYCTNDENEFSIVWNRNGIPYMNGGLVNHEGDWSIHT